MTSFGIILLFIFLIIIVLKSAYSKGKIGEKMIEIINYMYLDKDKYTAHKWIM